MNTHTAGDFLAALYQLSIDLLNHRQPDQVVQLLVDQVALLVHSPFTELMLYRDEQLVVQAYTETEPFIKGDVIARSEGRLAWQAFDTRQPAVLENYSTWQYRRPIYNHANLYAVADVPILVGDQCIGILALGRNQPDDPFTPDDIQKSIILSQLAGAAITNAALYADALHEIEQRKQAEEALRRSETQFRAMTDNMREMVAYIDVDGRIVYASPSYWDGLGYNPDEMIGHYALEYTHPDDQAIVCDLFQGTVFKGSKSRLIEFRCMHRSGYAVWMEASGAMIRSRDEQMIGVLLVLRDIHERHELEQLRLESERLSVTLQKEQELSRLKSRMMTRISHEFRTPLAHIQVTSDLVMRYFDRLTAEQREARLRSIQPQVQQITYMLDNISSVINPPRVMDMVPVGLLPLSEQVIHELREALASRLPIQVSVIPPLLVVHADRPLLQQMLRHLLLNAIQFSPPNAPILLSIREQANEVILLVQDSGISIPADDQPRIFEPFFRGSNIGEISGLGVGLSIARAIVEAHGGSIEVASCSERGTQVVVTLPKNVSHDPASFALIP